MSRTHAGVRLSSNVRCSASCTIRVRVRIPSSLARTLALSGPRVGRMTVIASSALRRGGPGGALRVGLTLPPEIAARALPTALTVTATADDEAHHRASAALGRAVLRP